jgi:hypothetical protein
MALNANTYINFHAGISPNTVQNLMTAILTTRLSSLLSRRVDSIPALELKLVLP